MDFRPRLCRQASGPGVIYAYNSETEPINFSDILILDTDFALTSDTCSPTLAHHATCAVSFVFTPTGTGLDNADLIFTDDSAISTQTIPLTGYGK